MRTEEQKIAREPVTASFGGKEYKIRVLTLGESREWKQNVAKLMDNSVSQIQTNDSDSEKFSKTLLSFMLDSPNTMIDLFFSYAKDLNREEIEQVATEEEISIAWDKVREVAFPLAQTLVQTINKMTPQGKSLSSS